MTVWPVIDPPGPFASTKDLRDFLDRWEGTREADKLKTLQTDLRVAREELARRGDKIVS